MGDLMHIVLGKLLEQVVNERPEHEVVVYPDRNLRYTYKQFDNLCRQAAKGYMKLGIKKGDHMAIWATNHPEWVTSQFATGKMGAVLVTVNTNYRAIELEYLVKWSDILKMSEEESNHVLDERMSTLNPDDVINMQYTSGTTGFPKGIMLTHTNLVNNAANIASYMNLTYVDRMCIPIKRYSKGRGGKKCLQRFWSLIEEKSQFGLCERASLWVFLR